MDLEIPEPPRKVITTNDFKGGMSSTPPNFVRVMKQKCLEAIADFEKWLRDQLE